MEKKFESILCKINAWLFQPLELCRCVIQIPYYLAYALIKAGFKEIKVHADRLKNSAKILMPIFYISVKLCANLVYGKFRRENKKTYEENTNFIININSLPLLLSRTVIIEAIK